jgi:hypothetical protein
VALAVFSVVLRRRTPASMRGARLALCFLALIERLVDQLLARAKAQLMAQRLGARYVHWAAGASSGSPRCPYSGELAVRRAAARRVR